MRLDGRQLSSLLHGDFSHRFVPKIKRREKFFFRDELIVLSLKNQFPIHDFL